MWREQATSLEITEKRKPGTLSSTVGSQAASAGGEAMVQFGVPPNRVDVAKEIDGVAFPEAWESRTIEPAEFAGRRVPLSSIAIRKLIGDKESMRRRSDLADLKYSHHAGQKEAP